MLLLLIFEVGADMDSGAVFLFGIVAMVGFVLFIHEKSDKEK